MLFLILHSGFSCLCDNGVCLLVNTRFTYLLTYLP